MTPRVISVPGPARYAVHPIVLVFALMFGLLGLACIWFLLTGGSRHVTVIDRGAYALGTIFCPVMAAGVCWLYWKGNREYRRRRMHDDSPQANSATARAIGRAWRIPGAPPSLRHVRRILKNTGDDDPERACVVCMGRVGVPPPGEYRFEPEVVSPTRAVVGHFRMVAAGLLIGLIVFVLALVLPIPRRITIVGAVSSGVVAGLIPAVYWLIRVAVRPAYLRIAPGIIQILSYRPFSATPRVHSYPVAVGTLVILTRIDQEVCTQFSLGQTYDKFDLSGFVDLEQIFATLSHALVSTAPTPPLSDEWLVG